MFLRQHLYNYKKTTKKKKGNLNKTKGVNVLYIEKYKHASKHTKEI